MEASFYGFMYITINSIKLFKLLINKLNITCVSDL